MHQQRLAANPNLILHFDSQWKGYPVQGQYAPFIVSYLEGIERTILNAIAQHPRSCAFRVDLCLQGCNVVSLGQHVMTRFIASLKAQMRADEQRKRRSGRVYPSALRYVWAKELTALKGEHYHVLLLVNRDAYCCLGGYEAEAGNMAARIKKAWASALGMAVTDVQAKGLVHFPKNSVYRLNSQSTEYHSQMDDLFYRVSYLAKACTKMYGDNSHHFACSQS